MLECLLHGLLMSKTLFPLMATELLPPSFTYPALRSTMKTQGCDKLAFSNSWPPDNML